MRALSQPLEPEEDKELSEPFKKLILVIFAF